MKQSPLEWFEWIMDRLLCGLFAIGVLMLLPLLVPVFLFGWAAATVLERMPCEPE